MKIFRKLKTWLAWKTQPFSKIHKYQENKLSGDRRCILRDRKGIEDVNYTWLENAEGISYVKFSDGVKMMVKVC